MCVCVSERERACVCARSHALSLLCLSALVLFGSRQERLALLNYLSAREDYLPSTQPMNMDRSSCRKAGCACVCVCVFVTVSLCICVYVCVRECVCVCVCQSV